jgi:cell division protein FtsW (lipid II flippase)
MELFENLASVGLTTRVLQFLVIGGIAIFLVGMYWKYIVIGAGVLFCVTVFAMSSGTSMKLDSPSVKIAPEDVVPAEFIEDCIKFNDMATKSSCEKLWRDEGNGKE